MARDYCDALVIEALADAEATLREANRQLIDLVANLAVENALLKRFYHRELFGSIDERDRLRDENQRLRVDLLLRAGGEGEAAS